MSQIVVTFVVNCRDVCRKLSWHFFSRPLPAVPFWISPNDHDHFWVHLAEPHFSFLGYPRMPHQMPFYTVEHRETTKIFHLMCHQMPFWCGMRCKTFLEDYGCGCVWAVPEESASQSASWMSLGTWLGVPRKRFAKKHSLGHSEPGAQKHPRSTPWGTFQPGAPGHSCKRRPGWQLFFLAWTMALETSTLRFSCRSSRAELKGTN